MYSRNQGEGRRLRQATLCRVSTGLDAQRHQGRRGVPGSGCPSTLSHWVIGGRRPFYTLNSDLGSPTTCLDPLWPGPLVRQADQ